jgi:hypothetical protein
MFIPLYQISESIVCRRNSGLKMRPYDRQCEKNSHSEVVSKIHCESPAGAYHSLRPEPGYVCGYLATSRYIIEPGAQNYSPLLQSTPGIRRSSSNQHGAKNGKMGLQSKAYSLLLTTVHAITA